MNKMSFKDWCVCIGVSVATLAVVWSVSYGAWQLLIDTGHAILH